MISSYFSREQLIDSLKKGGIADDRVLSAMASVPREKFVDSDQAGRAFEDSALPISSGQTISQPFVVATMTAALDLTDRHRVLEIGTGSGYQAAILAKLARRVYTIERHRPLYDQAQQRFAALQYRNITTLYGDGMKGWPVIHNVAPEPFDRIILTAAARNKPPQALIDQLAVGGIMIAPVGDAARQMLKRYEKLGEDTWSENDLMPVRFVPLLPDTARPEASGPDLAGETP